MASFTDQIMTFNPHISQLPVDDMIKVGMLKQGQYDAGVEKVNQYISNIQGLDVINSAQKQYVDSSLGNLNEQLKKVAGADFSNQQLVSQIGGMAAKIAKDPIVRNAVASAANYRKGLADIEEHRKNGTSAVDNEWDYQDKASKYMNNTDLKASFNDRFTPFVDLQKKSMEVLKSLHADEHMQEIPFIRNMDGSIDYDKTSAAMTKEGVEGISAAKIQNAISAVMTPDDLNQMSISGRYTFRGHTGESLAELSQKKYEKTVEQATSQIAALTKFAELNKANATTFNKTQSAIAELKLQIGEGGKPGTLKTQLDNEKAWIMQNPEEAKAQIYKDGFVKQFGNAFSWEKTTLEYLKNPLQEQKNWEKDYALNTSKFYLDKSKFENEVRHQGVMEAIDWQKLGVSKAELDLKMRAAGGAGFSSNLGLNSDIKLPSVAMHDEIDNNVNTANSLTKEVATGMGVTPTELEAQIKKYQEDGKTGIPVAWRDKVDQIVEARNQAKAVSDRYKAAETEVLKSPEAKGLQDDINFEVATRQAVTISTGKEEYTFTPKELLALAGKARSTKTLGGATFAGTANTDDKTTYVGLSAKEEAAMRNPAVKTQLEGMLSTYGHILHAQRKNMDKVQAKIEERLMSTESKWVPKLSLYATPDAGSRNFIEGVANTVAHRIKNDTGTGNSDGNPDIITNWLADEKQKAGLKYEVYNQGNSHQLWITNGKDVQKLNLSPSEAVQIPGVKINPNENIITRMDNSDGNSNVTKSPTGALFQRYKFNGVKNLNVVGDLQRNMSNPNMVYPEFRLKIDNKWVFKQYESPMDIEHAKSFISNATDQQILDIFADELKKK